MSDRFFGPSESELERVEIRALWRIWLREGDIIDLLGKIIKLLTPKLYSARIDVMPKTVHVGDVSKATLVGLDQNGQPFPIDATYQVAYSAANPATATFGVPAADGSADVTAVAADPGNAISAAITRPDGQVIQASPDTLVIEAAAAVLTSASVSLQ